MSKGGRLVILGCAFAALSAGAWAWMDARHARAQARVDAWMAYCRGPLSQLLEGSTRGRELLEASLQRPLNAQQRKELAEDAGLVSAAYASANGAVAGVGDDPFFEPLRQGLRWHAELADASKDWNRLAGRKDLIPDALSAERGLRHNLSAELDAERERIFASGRIGLDRGLEINALLYSLKE
jgi:hypothetical protein